MMGYEGFGILHAIFSALSIALVVIVIIMVVRWFAHSDKSKLNLQNFVGGDSALDILKKRYARGEIDKKEFEEKKADLNA